MPPAAPAEIPSLRPLYGHERLRERLATAARNGRLPASLLLTGPAGVGKQRLALWLAQRLLCDAAGEDHTEPCGRCRACTLVLRAQHPDLHWFFPRPRPSGGDASVDDVRGDLAEAAAERLSAHGLWGPVSGLEALHVATVRALVAGAARRPAMASRSVFVVAQAERMVAQEGADQAANAFLKLLEEPPPHCTLVLTTSEPGALLPTIRSRVVTVRVPPVGGEAMAAFRADPVVAARLADAAVVDDGSGAPGRLLGAEDDAAAADAAEAVLAAALAPAGPQGDATRAAVAAAQGVAGARGAFSRMLEALIVALHGRTRALVAAGDERAARRTAAAVAQVEAARARAQGNVSPALLTAVLLDELADRLGVVGHGAGGQAA